MKLIKGVIILDYWYMCAVSDALDGVDTFDILDDLAYEMSLISSELARNRKLLEEPNAEDK